MSSQNDETKGLIMVFAFVGAILYTMVIFAIIALAFLSLVLTVVCLFAWNQPRRIGKHILTPQEARGFVKRGFIGAFLLPSFCIFLELFANVRINGDYLLHIVLGGYALGSIGIEILLSQDADNAPAQTIIPQSQQIAPPQQHEPPRIPFRFASWEDEDGR
jgi:hypothetical protein